MILDSSNLISKYSTQETTREYSFTEEEFKKCLNISGGIVSIIYSENNKKLYVMSKENKIVEDWKKDKK